MKYKHIVFDIDGTLIDSENAILRSLQEVLLRVTGKQYAFDELSFALGITGEDALERLHIENVTDVMRMWLEILRRHDGMISIYEGIETLLQYLSGKGYRLGIVSSKTRDMYDNDFARFGISHYFDISVCSDDTEGHKPTADPLLKYMEWAGAKRHEVLYVGDSVHDSQCAENAGVDFALAVWGSHTETTRAEYLLKQPSELTAILDRREQYMLECCVDSVESAIAAQEGGADRLELCAALIIGGTSPGMALFEKIRENCSLPVRVLLRPRFGDFLYTEYEFEILKREVAIFREAGAEGVVIGCLSEDGNLHMDQMRALIAEAGTMKVTLHRAFDVCADPIRAYRQARELGIDTILTSGQQSCCEDGIRLLEQLCEIRKEEGGPRIMAGAGVTPDVIRRFLSQTEITCYHLSAKMNVDSGMKYRREGVPMGLPAMSEYSILRTDKRIVSEANRVLMLEGI